MKYSFIFLSILVIGSCKGKLDPKNNKAGLTEDVGLALVEGATCRENSEGPRFQPKSLLVCLFEKNEAESQFKFTSANLTEELSVKHPVQWSFDLGESRFCLGFKSNQKFDDHGNKYYEIVASHVDALIPNSSSKSSESFGCKYRVSGGERVQEIPAENLQSNFNYYKFERKQQDKLVTFNVFYEVRDTGGFPKKIDDLEKICKSYY